MTNFLKDLIKKEINMNNIINNSIKLKDNITNNNGIHIYNTESSFVSKYNSKLTFDFSNKTAWYWNKNIELRIKINNNKILAHSLEEDKDNKYNTIIHNDDNIKLVSVIINKQKENDKENKDNEENVSNNENKDEEKVIEEKVIEDNEENVIEDNDEEEGEESDEENKEYYLLIENVSNETSFYINLKKMIKLNGILELVIKIV